MAQTRTIQLAQPVPVLSACDALVVESTLAGCVAACLLAEQGCRTTLVSSSTSLPHELVVVRQPWSNPAQWKLLPARFQEALHRSVETELAPGRVLLNLARLAIQFEDLLLDAGARLLYGLHPCSVDVDGSGLVRHVVFGGKAGLQAIRVGRVVDCTPAAMVAQRAGAAVTARSLPRNRLRVSLACKVVQQDRPGPLTVTRGQMSDDKVKPVADPWLEAPGVPELRGSRVPLHGPYAQITLQLPVNVSDPLWQSKLSTATRQALVRVGRSIAQARSAAGLHAVYLHRFSGALLMDAVVRVDPAHLANVSVLSPAAAVDDAAARKMVDPFHAAQEAQRIVPQVLAPRRSGRSLRRRSASIHPTSTSKQPQAMLRCADAPALHARDHLAISDAMTLPELDHCDVLVVGAGTSGVPAALASAQQGARTTLVDQHADVGGVRTIGGVGSYWFGRVTPFQKRCDDLYDQVTARSGVAEEVAMMQCLLDAGVQVLAPCPVVGAVVREGCVEGVVIVTSHGLAIVSGKTVVDASGDADIAAWAGAPFEYGNGRDALTLWGSFGNFNFQKRTASRQYESTIEVRDPWDLTRSIVRGRRRPGLWRTLDHEMPQHYVTPRETRRIRADSTITYSGILAGQTFEDLMVVCESNFDIKGLATSDIGACGVISSWDVYRKFQAAVPWRAVLPRGVGNLIVAGRAYSASHDAIALARMQRDMVSLGGAVGLAAARSAAAGVEPAHLDVPQLQQAWLDLGTLRQDDFQRYARPWQYAAHDAQRDCRSVLTRRGLTSEPLARLMRSPLSVPALREAFASAKSGITRVRLARALGYLGDASGVPLLLESIERQIKGPLPRPLKRCLAIPPEHGWAAEPVYSLRAIAMAGAAEQAATLMAVIARKVEDAPERFASRLDSQFEYVLAICAVAERSPSPSMLGPLEILLRKRCLSDLTVTFDRDLRFAADPVHERRAYLELCIGRTLARCADRRGFDILLRYCDDFRGALARSAQDELAVLIGCAVPPDPLARRQLVQRHLPRAVAVPFTKRLD